MHRARRRSSKIRGFRVELNDIDSNLCLNPLIRDCKALVRRDRYEEPILVSYIVPELNEWPQWLKSRGLEKVEDEGTDMGTTIVYNKRFRWMQAEVRDHLKGRLPNYAVPTVFIVLSKLPLIPNGKVDKANLPFPDIAEQAEEASKEDLERWDSMTETERVVATKWAGLISGLNAKTLTPQNDFFQLGGHSILAQQMLLDIRRETGANVSMNTIYEYPTIATFSSRLTNIWERPIKSTVKWQRNKIPNMPSPWTSFSKRCQPSINQQTQRLSVYRPSQLSFSLARPASYAHILSRMF